MAGNVRIGDKGGISPALLRQEDVERKNAMVYMNAIHLNTSM